MLLDAVCKSIHCIANKQCKAGLLKVCEKIGFNLLGLLTYGYGPAGAIPEEATKMNRELEHLSIKAG